MRCATCGFNVSSCHDDCWRCGGAVQMTLVAEAPRVRRPRARRATPATRLCAFCRTRSLVRNPPPARETCPACSTWMHAACWDANARKCPTYGCHEQQLRERDARRPSVVAPRAAPAPPTPHPAAPARTSDGAMLVAGLLVVGIPVAFCAGWVPAGLVALGALVVWAISLGALREA